mgnify:FL=1
MTSKVIDVSYYQRNIDYDAVEAAGVRGVIIKISEGCSKEDTWVRHAEECKARGIPWGVYCFSRAQTPERAREEAQTVLGLLGDDVPPMGIWYDCEADECFGEG